MDEGLFRKHILQIQKVQDNKEQICIHIFESTGVEILKEEIVITKNNIKLQISSVKRSVLVRKNIKEILKEKGYILNN